MLDLCCIKLDACRLRRLAERCGQTHLCRAEPNIQFLGSQRVEAPSDVKLGMSVTLPFAELLHFNLSTGIVNIESICTNVLRGKAPCSVFVNCFCFLLM